MDGLADESEGVRQAALAAGRTLVDLYALSALELLLPAVERGCAHENWRIRQSSVELLGDLLFKVCGLVLDCASVALLFRCWLCLYAAMGLQSDEGLASHRESSVDVCLARIY